MPTPAPQPAVQPVAAPSAQPANVAGLFQDRPAAVAPVQPVANPFETLDRTKVMSFQFRNAPWPLVFAAFAEATGLELRMQAMPRGTFNRWDSARYTPSQTLAILNSELARMGCQAKVFGTALYVVPSGSGDAAIPATTASPVITPAAASNLQMPQYPGVPASATANPAVR
ncbi:MAG TPA: hypothetical protein VEI07_16395 [Planctomycetaceae bacterium]|nr:hypothetical protein [Planctomycetaceae bacterium]